MKQGLSAGGCIFLTSVVSQQRPPAHSYVESAASIIHESLKTIRSILINGIVHERLSAGSRILFAGNVAIKRLRAVSRVSVANCVVKKSLETGRGVRCASGVVIERLRSDRCVPDPAGEAEKGIASLGCVSPGVASVRGWIYGVRYLYERKADHQEQNERETVLHG